MIESIKGDIMSHLNMMVRVVSRENRSRKEIFDGYIAEVYSHVFVVRNGDYKKSYSYSDILSKDISITFM